MSEPFLVNRVDRWPMVLAIILCFVLLALGLVVSLASRRIIPVIAIGVPAAAYLFIQSAWYYGKKRKEKWLEITEQSIIVEHADGSVQEIDDRDVLCMSLIDKRRFKNGLLKAVNRRFVIWLANGDTPLETLEFQTITPIEQEDPLNPLVERISRHLIDTARSELATGHVVGGEHWRMDSDSLIVNTPGKSSATIPLVDVVDCKYVDRHVCVWRRGQDEVAAKVSLRTPNAHVLGVLLEEQAAKRDATNDEPPSLDGLGRIIFERKPKPSSIVACLVFALIAGLTSLGMIAGSLISWNLGVLLVGAGAALLSGALVLGWLHCKKAVFRCHNWGVYQNGLGGEKQIRYTAVVSFTFGAIRQFVNGAYTGTSLNMAFTPILPDAKPIHYSAQLQHMDDELDNLRDHVARVVAHGMAQRLKAGEEVPWTKHLLFLPDGIEYQPSGIFKRGEPTFYRFGEITGIDIQQGYFCMWVRSAKKAVVQEACSEENFYPGFYLMTMLLTPPEVPAASP